MLTIVQSRICVNTCRDNLHLPPFEDSSDIECNILSFKDINELYSLKNSNNLIIYTNIYPLKINNDDLKSIEKIAVLNSVNVGIVGHFIPNVKKIIYPRKNNIHFPALSVAFVSLHPALLWKKIISKCFFDSVTLVMFASLAYDCTFENIVIRKKYSDEFMAIVRLEYERAHDHYSELGLEIHGYRTKSKVPYAEEIQQYHK